VLQYVAVRCSALQIASIVVGLEGNRLEDSGNSQLVEMKFAQGATPRAENLHLCHFNRFRR